jgi:alkylation response protein AidB-like acyl-CoA dehydrogenase
LEIGSGPLLIEHFDALDYVLVLDAREVRLVDAAEIATVATERPLDVLTPVHLVERLPDGEVVAEGDSARRLRRKGAILTSALLVGIAAATAEGSVEYAQERVQFGKPIGSFQAVKHAIANARVRADLARAAVYAAAGSLEGLHDDDEETAVTAAKITAANAALENAKQFIHVLGGIGFTWEVDAHLFLKRAWVLRTHFGAVERHAERIAEIA